MPSQGRLGDKAQCLADAHGCPACPHPVTGPAVNGSPNVMVNGRPALRMGDGGIHAACCGPNLWKAQGGSATVFINGRAAHRLGDPTGHCGGVGCLIEGSSDVFVGDLTSSGIGAGSPGLFSETEDKGAPKAWHARGTALDSARGNGMGAGDCTAEVHHQDRHGGEGPEEELRLRLVDAEGQTVARERYRVEWPDGRVEEGRLDETGRAVLTAAVGAGTPIVRFLYRFPADVRALSGHTQERAPRGARGEDPGEEDNDDDLTASFDCPPSAAEHSFELQEDCCLVDVIGDDDFYCEDENQVIVAEEIRRAIERARELAGEPFSVSGGVCRVPPGICPPELRRHHGNGDAAHITELRGGDTGLLMRVAELAGLWGLDVSGETGERRLQRKAIHVQGTAQAPQRVYPLGVRTMPTAAPWSGLSVIALRRGRTRQIHLHRSEAPRVVYSIVDNATWRSLPFEANSHGGAYKLHKSRWWMASNHRQWGREHTIGWLLGLCAFYKAQMNTQIGIGDISHIVGEDQTDHRSHEEGVDVDLYVLDVLGQGGEYPEAYYCTGADPVRHIKLSRMRAPSQPLSESNRTPEYSPDRGAEELTGGDFQAVLRGYATILAYCAATKALFDIGYWQGIQNREVGRMAEAIARGAFEAGWRDEWGRVPPWGGDPYPWLANGIDEVRLPRRIETSAAQPYDHADHVHIRLRSTPQRRGDDG